MTLPANIRVNMGAPFPSLVKGSGPVTIAKNHGIWTVGLSFAGLASLTVGTDPTQMQVLVWNNLTKTFQQTTIAALQSAGLLTTTVTAAMSPYTPLVTDFFLLVDTSGGPVEIDLPLAVQRGGIALSIKDVAGSAAVNNITIKPQGAPANETIDNYTNAAPLKINANYGAFRLLPLADKYIIAP
jgi:hypothetical protein